MVLLKEHELITDLWTLVESTDDPSNVDHPIITLEAWNFHNAVLSRGNAPLGIYYKAINHHWRSPIPWIDLA